MYALRFLIIQILLPEITQATQGIIPHIVESVNMVLFDTSGQQQYYLSHYAYLQSLSSATPAVFVIVFNSTSPTKEIQKQLNHWFGMIDAICCNCPQKSSIIAVGTHAKRIKKKKKTDLSTTADKIIKNAVNTEFEGIAYIDFIDMSSRNLRYFFYLFYKSIDAIDGRFSPLSCKCHQLYAILKDNVSHDSISFTQLLQMLHDGPLSSHFDEISEVAKHLYSLAERGLIIFVSNKEPHNEGCIVLSTGMRKLLHDVIGTLFDTTTVNRQTISTNGIITLSGLEKIFPTLGITVPTIAQFLFELELCIRIDECSVDSNIIPMGAALTPCLLFPGLISSSLCMPDGIQFTDHCFGLLMCPTDDESYFPPYLIQALIAKLLSRFCIQKTSKCSIVNTPCKIWNQGIHWNTQDGIYITLEVKDQLRTLYLAMTLPHHTQYTQQISVLQVVKSVLHTTCPLLSIVESVVDPHQATKVFTRRCSPHLFIQVVLSFFKEAIRNDESTVPAVCAGHDEVKISDWTSVEPNIVPFIQAYTMTK